MDSCALERERIDACVFKVMTADGPVSMCLHNAKRDGFILQPMGIHTPGGKEYWQPLTGQTTLNAEAPAMAQEQDENDVIRPMGDERVHFALNIDYDWTVNDWHRGGAGHESQ